MIWSAPIWLNNLLLNTLKLVINLIYILIFVLFIWLIYRLIIFIRNNGIKGIVYFFKSKKTSYIFIAILVSFLYLKIFYYPQKLIPSNYAFDSVSININPQGNKSFSEISQYDKRIKIDDKRQLEKLTEILNKYTCKKNIDGGWMYGNGFVVKNSNYYKLMYM